MADLIYMMNTLVDKDGKILVEGLMDSVAPVTPEEMATYKDIDFDVKDFQTDLKTNKLITNQDKAKTLMARLVRREDFGLVPFLTQHTFYTVACPKRQIHFSQLSPNQC